MMYLVTRVINKNDVNGNPQRGWLVTQMSPDTNTFTRFIDEGYEGSKVLTDYTFGEYRMAGTVNVSTGEYRRLKKEYK